MSNQFGGNLAVQRAAGRIIHVAGIADPRKMSNAC
jgi:hypothetical protein